ncbi:MAG: LysM peptidoglycan-binding domain-containing protein [Lachnospiraceae bacterium]|nr:LysM peptidoglycan-binding domain-containing protein [Lachnospiraceae bacterium]
MELPKNITQIGEADKSCKIYVEDYVMSYMKQMNRFAEDKEIAVALYGRRSTEQATTYIFIYGACKLTFLQREVRHLSQAHQQEIERLRYKYFRECEFVGYLLLNGEMIEGIHIYEQGCCRYVKGYACFYEKNDSMLSYMLDNRTEEVQPEVVEQEKFEQVKQRQEERRSQTAEKSVVSEYTVPHEVKEKKEYSLTDAESRIRGMRFAAASMFVLLCMVCVVTLQTEGLGQEVMKNIRSLMGGLVSKETVEEEDISVMGDEVINTLVAEEQLTEAIRRENREPALQMSTGQTPEPTLEPTPEPMLEPTPEPMLEPTPEPALEPTPEPTLEPAPVLTPIPTLASTPVPAEAPVQSEQVRNVYIIRTGDTLIGISTSLYGSESYVKEICELNGISDPDNIQIGQKILLP